MVFAYPLVRGNVAEHVILLLVGSSHADWTYQALLRCKLFAFFSKLLGLCPGTCSHSRWIFPESNRVSRSRRTKSHLRIVAMNETSHS